MNWTWSVKCQGDSAGGRGRKGLLLETSLHTYEKALEGGEAPFFLGVSHVWCPELAQAPAERETSTRGDRGTREQDRGLTPAGTTEPHPASEPLPNRSRVSPLSFRPEQALPPAADSKQGGSS